MIPDWGHLEVELDFVLDLQVTLPEPISPRVVVEKKDESSRGGEDDLREQSLGNPISSCSSMMESDGGDGLLGADVEHDDDHAVAFAVAESHANETKNARVANSVWREMPLSVQGKETSLILYSSVDSKSRSPSHSRSNEATSLSRIVHLSPG